MTSPLDQCRDALRRLTGAAFPVSTEIDSSGYAWSHAYLDSALPGARDALAAADAALAAQPEPVAWAQLGMRNGHTYVRMNYEGNLYPPPADVQRNLNLTPLYAAPVAAPVAARPRDDSPHINRWAVREVWFDENGEPGLHRDVDLRDAAPVAQPLTDQDRRDAERYRWLLETGGPWWAWSVRKLGRPDLNAAIDAAMSAPKEPA